MTSCNSAPKKKRKEKRSNLSHLERLYDSTFYLLSRLLDRYFIYISMKNWVKKFFDFKNFPKISLTILPKNPIQTRSFQNKITNYNRYPLEIPKHQIREPKKTSLTLRLPRFQIILKTSSDRIFLFLLFQKKESKERKRKQGARTSCEAFQTVSPFSPGHSTGFNPRRSR